jgi:hypothetical protein
MAGSLEHGNETPAFIKYWEFSGTVTVGFSGPVSMELVFSLKIGYVLFQMMSSNVSVNAKQTQYR